MGQCSNTVDAMFDKQGSMLPCCIYRLKKNITENGSMRSFSGYDLTTDEDAGRKN